MVVGGGPVGCLTAAALLRAGAAPSSLLIVERAPALYPAPRAVSLDDECVRSLGRLVSPAFLARTTATNLVTPPIHIAAAVCGGGETPTLTSLFGPALPERVAASGGLPDTGFFHQPAFESALREHLHAAGVPFMQGWTLEGIDRVNGGTPHFRCRLRSLDGTLTVVDAPYLIGADGGGSTTRGLLGVQFTGDSYPDQPWLVVDCEGGEGDPALRPWTEFNFLSARHDTLGTRPLVHVPLPGPSHPRRFELLLLPGEDPVEAASAPRVALLLQEYFGVTLGRSGLRVVRSVVYTFHARRAESWLLADRTAVLVGDAAHCMPPFRGQGLCAGIRDAASVGWRLAAVASGAASPALLDGYEVERLPQLVATTAITIRLGSLLMLTQPRVALVLRDAAVRVFSYSFCTRGYARAPFRPPGSIPRGLVDFHSPWGRRVWGGAPPALGWTARDAAQGCAVPNVAVLRVDFALPVIGRGHVSPQPAPRTRARRASGSDAAAGAVPCVAPPTPRKFPVIPPLETPLRLDEGVWPEGVGWALLLSPSLGESHPHACLTLRDSGAIPPWMRVIGCWPAGTPLPVCVAVPHTGGGASRRWPEAPWVGAVDGLLLDAPGELADWFTDSHGEAAILRPDGVVFGVYTANELAGGVAHASSVLRSPFLRPRPPPLYTALARCIELARLFGFAVAVVVGGAGAAAVWLGLVAAAVAADAKAFSLLK